MNDGLSAPATALKWFERVVIITLLVMMMAVVLVATYSLAFVLIEELLRDPPFRFDINELFSVFGFFLLVLIGFELVETVRIYLSEKHVRVEFVMMVAMIAITRKLITLEVTRLSGLTLLGVAALIAALGAAYFLVRRAHEGT